eukprot:470057-Hanusia_phi.AAC.1
MNPDEADPRRPDMRRMEATSWLRYTPPGEPREYTARLVRRYYPCSPTRAPIILLRNLDPPKLCRKLESLKMDSGNFGTLRSSRISSMQRS